jgi:hypothetical protein
VPPCPGVDSSMGDPQSSRPQPCYLAFLLPRVDGGPGLSLATGDQGTISVSDFSASRGLLGP